MNALAVNGELNNNVVPLSRFEKLGYTGINSIIIILILFFLFFYYCSIWRRIGGVSDCVTLWQRRYFHLSLDSFFIHFLQFVYNDDIQSFQKRCILWTSLSVIFFWFYVRILNASKHLEHWGHDQPYAFVLQLLYQILKTICMICDLPFNVSHLPFVYVHSDAIDLSVFIATQCCPNKINWMRFNWFGSFVWDQFQIIAMNYCHYFLFPLFCDIYLH